jgi:hypothetical protein
MGQFTQNRLDIPVPARELGKGTSVTFVILVASFPGCPS